MRQVNKRVLSGVGSTATINGDQIDANQLINMSFHLLVGDATAAGTFKIQASNDVAQVGPTPFTVTNWVDIPSASVTQAAGTRQALISLNNCAYRWVRAVWVQSASSATPITVNFMAQGA